MKLIIREYLASLKEREELDAILPDLLSELGYTVYSRPGIGTVQHGVDIAALGPKNKDGQKLYLFSVKSGDLTRKDWDGVELQSLRPSLNEILDVYIPTKILADHKDLDIVICLCFGGDIKEQVRGNVTGFINSKTTDRISFEEWNGDKIADLLLQGMLREKFLPSILQSKFRKAVAMVDEPDISYNHFSDLICDLRETVISSDKIRVRVIRQIYICLWILYVWARDVDNVEAAYLASELSLLNVWHLSKPFINKNNKNAKASTAVLHHLIDLHLRISAEFLENKILPHVEKRHAISRAVHSRSSVDINLKLFDLLGRIALTGIWLNWYFQYREIDMPPESKKRVAELATGGIELIKNNPVLYSPICDEQAIDIALFLFLCATSDCSKNAVSDWIVEMVNRYSLTIRTHGKYTCAYSEYRYLISHPREQTEDYRKEATSGSILIPLLAAWLMALNNDDAVEILYNLTHSELEHCTLQLWLPDEDTEEMIYTGGKEHGVALCDLKISNQDTRLLDTIAKACEDNDHFVNLTPWQTNFWPIILMACRHYRLPVPPQFWIEFLRPSSIPNSEGMT